QPASTTWLGKNESLTLSLRVLEESSYGKRSGKLRFYYHGKPMEISIQLKEPPTIRLGFLNVPNTTSIHDSFILRLPQNQKEINCQITTDSDKPLTINSISLSPASNVIDSSPLPKGAKSILQKAIKIKKTEHYNFSFETVETPDIVLTIHFDELGVRHFGLKLYQVPTANLIDHIDKFLIGENAIILGSDACYTTFSIRNEVETEGLGKGRAEKIEFHNLPSWLSISPSILPAIEPGQTVTFTLKVISSSFTEAKQEHVQVKISYYDPQLECSVTRPEPISIPFEFVAPREYKNWIAIDFGTSNTCAAIIEGTSFRTLYIDAATSGSYESPTCVQFVNETEKLYECGLSAYGKRFSGSRAMKATAWAFKPQLARSTEPVTQTYLDIIQGQPHSKTVDQIIAIYAKYLLESVKLKSGIAPKKAVITFPVTFGKRQRERLAEAFQKAGLDEVITTISEPVALAIHYAYLHKGEIFSKPSTFAVFDFGGGTIDIAIFQIEPTHSDKKEPAFQLLDVAGMELGGEFLTFELAKLIYKKLVPANQRATFAFPKKLEDLTTSDSDIIRDNYSRIAELAENIKRRLYVDKEIFATEIQRSLFDGQNRQTFSAKLVQQEFEEILKAHLQHPVTLLQSMLSSLYKRGKLKEEKLDYLILGGNSSRLPLVTNMLSETLFAGNSRHILLDSENIKLGVMKGALLYCAAPEALPFPVEDVNQTLPCRVGLLGTGFTFDLLFERGLIANSKEATTSRKLRFSKGRESLRLYYYFGHEEQPAILNNQKMKEYEIKCPFLEPFTSSAPVESQTLFHLLPDGNGIEVTFQINEEKFQQIVPILGGS
ncbi:MAG: Hsp70 family protein, partial [Blastocatellia bacterium]|nr:Hsp70 family protein [Blastocatellia bacterium]